MALCGIVGYVGRRPARELLLQGLRRLEYRGYDSAGISVIADGRIEAVRAVGPLRELEAKLASVIRIRNRVRRGRRRCRGRRAAGDHRHRAHPLGDPRADQRGERPPALRHRRPHPRRGQRDRRELHGLKDELVAAGAEFTSETDAEVIAHLIADCMSGDLVEAVRLAFARLRGHYAFVAMSLDEPELLVGARKECPLIVGRGDGEQFLASGVPPSSPIPGACNSSRATSSSLCARRASPSSTPW